MPFAEITTAGAGLFKSRQQMKALLGTLLLVLAMQAQAQTNLEDDLDGNSGALQSSEMPPRK